MLSRPNSMLAAFLGVAITLLTSVEPAQSQDPTPSPDPSVYKFQLMEAVALGRKTLRGIAALPYNDSIPIDPSVLNDARSTYVLIRAARHGMELQRERKKYADPMLDLAFKRIDHAWNLARFPIDYRDWPRNQYIPRATKDLTEALRLIDQALVILP